MKRESTKIIRSFIKLKGNAQKVLLGQRDSDQINKSNEIGTRVRLYGQIFDIFACCQEIFEFFRQMKCKPQIATLSPISKQTFDKIEEEVLIKQTVLQFLPEYKSQDSSGKATTIVSKAASEKEPKINLNTKFIGDFKKYCGEFDKFKKYNVRAEEVLKYLVKKISSIE